MQNQTPYYTVQPHRDSTRYLRSFEQQIVPGLHRFRDKPLLYKQVEETVTVKRMVPVQVEFEEQVAGEPDADGNPTTTTVTRTRTEMLFLILYYF